MKKTISTLRSWERWAGRWWQLSLITMILSTGIVFWAALEHRSVVWMVGAIIAPILFLAVTVRVDKVVNALQSLSQLQELVRDQNVSDEDVLQLFREESAHHGHLAWWRVQARHTLTWSRHGRLRRQISRSAQR